VFGGLAVTLGALANPLALAQGWVPDRTKLNSDLETAVNRLPRSFGSSVDTLPPVVSMRKDLPKPQDQEDGSESCVGWTMGYGMLSFLQKRKDNPLSATYVYRWALYQTEYTEDNKWNNMGVDFPQGFEALTSQGSCSFGPPKMFHVFEGAAKKVVFERLGAESVREGRSQRLLFHPGKLPQTGIVNSMRKALSEGRPLPCGFAIPGKMRDGMGLKKMMSATGEEKLCLLDELHPGPKVDHAMLVIGYDDNRGLFEVMNSFGEDFGDGGYLWISYKLVSDLGNNISDRGDNPCLIAAWDYLWKKPETSFEDLQAEFDQGVTTAWVRLQDTKGEVNFRGESTTGSAVVTSLKPNDTLVATQVINVRDSYNARAKEGTANTMAIQTLHPGEKVTVKDMNVIERKGGEIKEYWIKVKRDL
jgi:hypothetical protein